MLFYTPIWEPIRCMSLELGAFRGNTHELICIGETRGDPELNSGFHL